MIVLLRAKRLIYNLLALAGAGKKNTALALFLLLSLLYIASQL